MAKVKLISRIAFLISKPCKGDGILCYALPNRIF